MAFVLDASATLPWCFRDEATSATDRLVALPVAGERIYVPAHWPSEILNGLTRATRRGRFDDASVGAFFEAFETTTLRVHGVPFLTLRVKSVSRIDEWRGGRYTDTSTPTKNLAVSGWLR